MAAMPDSFRTDRGRELYVASAKAAALKAIIESKKLTPFMDVDQSAFDFENSGLSLDGINQRLDSITSPVMRPYLDQSISGGFTGPLRTLRVRAEDQLKPYYDEFIDLPNSIKQFNENHRKQNEALDSIKREGDRLRAEAADNAETAEQLQLSYYDRPRPARIYTQATDTSAN